MAKYTTEQKLDAVIRYQNSSESIRGVKGNCYDNFVTGTFLGL